MTNKELLEWTENYAKSNAAFFGKLKEIKVKDDKVIVSYFDKDITYLAFPKIAEAKVSSISEDYSDEKSNKIVIVTFNKEENINELHKKWKEFAGIKNLTIMFVNPNAKGEMFWKINPRTHHFICDEKNLKQGLKTMAENVEMA